MNRLSRGITRDRSRTPVPRWRSLSTDKATLMGEQGFSSDDYCRRRTTLTPASPKIDILNLSQNQRIPFRWRLWRAKSAAEETCLLTFDAWERLRSHFQSGFVFFLWASKVKRTKRTCWLNCQKANSQLFNTFQTHIWRNLLQQSDPILFKIFGKSPKYFSWEIFGDIVWCYICYIWCSG